jgi:hypothetical protein
VVRALLAAALICACYSPHLQECRVACDRSSDCSSGQICGNDGWCATPANAGNCARVLNDAAPVRDSTATGSDAPPDADTSMCDQACVNGTCDQGTCVIDCSAYGSCNIDILCPASVPCRVVCGDKACAHHITCPPSQPCDIECTGAFACGDQIFCGTAKCTVTCSGFAACNHKTNCGSACACDVECTGSTSCPEASVCPGGMACTYGHGCTSAKTACDSCAM